MRYLKRWVQVLSVSLPTVFCLFAVSLFTESLAQAMGVCCQTSIIIARDLDAVSILSEMFVIARGKRGKS